MEVLYGLAELGGQKLALAMAAFFLEFDFNFIEEDRGLIFTLKSSLSEATLIFDLPIKS